VATYRREFRPSAQLAAPYVIAGVNVVAADTDDLAQEHLTAVRRARVARFVERGAELTDEQADAILASPQGRHLETMMRYTAVGTPHLVTRYLDEFATHAGADELIVVHAGPTVDARLRSLDLLADASGLAAA